MRHSLTVPRVHASAVHLCKLGWNLFRYVKSAWLRVGLHLLYYGSRANGDVVTVVIMGKGVVVHLALREPVASSSHLLSVQYHSSSLPIHIVHQKDGNLSFEATLLTWFPIACIDEKPVETSEGGLKRRRYFEKTGLGTEKRG